MIIDTIRSRRSTRAFLEKPIPSEILLLLLESARWAPSGSNKQPWLFVAVQDSVNIQKMKMFSPGLRGNPPVLLVLCSDTSVEGSTHLMDISMAAQNILLTATENGLGSCPVRSFNQRAVQSLLYLPSHVVPELTISLGYPAKPAKTPPRRAIEDLVHWERYGGHPSE
jgi:nitroreductase